MSIEFIPASAMRAGVEKRLNNSLEKISSHIANKLISHADAGYINDRCVNIPLEEGVTISALLPIFNKLHECGYDIFVQVRNSRERLCIRKDSTGGSAIVTEIIVKF